MASFQTPGPITLSVELGSGALQVAADAGPATEIQLLPARAGDAEAQSLIDEARIDHHGDTVTVQVPDGGRAGLFRRSPSVRVIIRMPAGSNLIASTKSADVAVTGELGDVRITTGSGNVQLPDIEGTAVVESGSGDLRLGAIAGDTNIQSASGDVVITTCCSVAKVHTASGDIEIGTTEGALDVRTASGDVVVREADGPVTARTASGDVQLQRVRGEEVAVVAASGDIEVGVEPGIAVWLDVSSLSGTVSSTLDPSDTQAPDRPTLQLRASSTSGDITIRSV